MFLLGILVEPHRSSRSPIVIESMEMLKIPSISYTSRSSFHLIFVLWSTHTHWYYLEGLTNSWATVVFERMEIFETLSNFCLSRDTSAWQTSTLWRYLEGLINLETPIVFERIEMLKTSSASYRSRDSFHLAFVLWQSCTFRRYLEVLIKAPGVFESMEILTTASASYLARDAIHLAFFLWRYVEGLIRAPVDLECKEKQIPPSTGLFRSFLCCRDVCTLGITWKATLEL